MTNRAAPYHPFWDDIDKLKPTDFKTVRSVFADPHHISFVERVPDGEGAIRSASQKRQRRDAAQPRAKPWGKNANYAEGRRPDS
jgi:hypothetical protein